MLINLNLVLVSISRGQHASEMQLLNGYRKDSQLKVVGRWPGMGVGGGGSEYLLTLEHVYCQRAK